MDKGDSLLAKLGVSALAGAAGYLFSCIVGAIGLALMMWVERTISRIYGGPSAIHASESIPDVAFILFFLVPIAFPFFLGLRLVLWALRRKDWPSFAGAGAICALVILLGMSDARFAGDHFWEFVWQYPPNIWVVVVGAFAGAAECLSERRVMAWLQSLRGPSPNSEPGK